MSRLRTISSWAGALALAAGLAASPAAAQSAGCTAEKPKAFRPSSDTRAGDNTNNARTGPSWYGTGRHAGAEAGGSYLFVDASTQGVVLMYASTNNRGHVGAGTMFGFPHIGACTEST